MDCRLSEKKSPALLRGFVIKDRQRLTLPGVILVPSALAGLTALFGMGRGDPRRYSHLKIFKGSTVHARPFRKEESMMALWRLCFDLWSTFQVLFTTTVDRGLWTVDF